MLCELYNLPFNNNAIYLFNKMASVSHHGCCDVCVLLPQTPQISFFGLLLERQTAKYFIFGLSTRADRLPALVKV